MMNVTFGNDRPGALNENFTGFGAFDSDDITLSNNTFSNIGGGAGFVSTNNITVRNNTFHDLRIDGIDFSGAQDGLIENNSFSDFYHQTSDHSDFIQFWATAGLRSNENIVIRNNFMVQGNGIDAQGIFMTSAADNMNKNILIENNVIYQSGFHGISISTASGVTIRNNTVISPPDTPTGYDVWISVSGATNVSVQNNISNIFTLDASASQSGNIVGYRATVPWNVGSYESHIYGELFKNGAPQRYSNQPINFESNFSAGANINNIGAQ